MTVTERFARWMADTAGIDGARLGPRLAGGNANVTRLVEAEDARFIVRHPPAAALSAKAAAGIEREARLLAAIADTGRAPALIGVCTDPAVLGAPFAVQQFVPGTAITTKLPAAYADDGETVSEIGRELVRAIADVHRVDPARLGTPRPQSASFLARQVARWREARRKDGVRDLPLFEQLGAWLASTMPQDTPVAILHGDYHLDNCLFDEHHPRLNAIIDWELTTVGDPMVDLGLLLMFWRRDPGTRPDRALGFPFVQAVSNRADVVPATALADLWSSLTGWSAERLDYYRVFAFWRLAAIVEGAYILYRRGQVDSAYARGLEQDVPNLLMEAAALVDGGAAL